MNTRKCKKCNIEKDIGEFHFSISSIKNQNTQYRRHTCKNCFNLLKIFRKQNIQNWYQELKKSLYCKNCGNSDHRVLDFHHEDALYKDISVSTAIGSGLSIERVRQEIEKCIVLCSNCHRIHHYDERVK
jgi:RNase P subunit RPR2